MDCVQTNAFHILTTPCFLFAVGGCIIDGKVTHLSSLVTSKQVSLMSILHLLQVCPVVLEATFSNNIALRGRTQQLACGQLSLSEKRNVDSSGIFCEYE